MARHEKVAPPNQQVTTRELEGAWLRAVAIVWSEPAKLAQLKRDPKQFLHAECGYDTPASLTLTVREAKESGGSWRWHMHSPPQGEVILDLPPPPELSDQPVALAELANAFAMVPLCVC